MHHHDASYFVHTFLLFPLVWWYTCHACLCHLLALYASLHACSHVHAWVLLASLSSILQHNEVTDIQSKLIFVSCGHHLFVCLFACLSFFLFACLPVCLLAFLPSCLFVYLCLSCLPPHAMLAISILLVCFCSLCALSMHLFLSIACLLVSCLCLYMYTHRVRAHGSRARSPRRKQNGWGCEHVDISQETVFSRFKGLASPIWLCTLLNPLPSSFLSLLDGLY